MVRFLYFYPLMLILTTSVMAQKGNLVQLSYLALGDSYTIGESVPASGNWPNQLVLRMNSSQSILAPPRIIATTGWTTDELIQGILKEKLEGTYDLVSLLIGVNNQYRGYPVEQYRKEFDQLLDRALHFAENNKGRIFVVSIPDYGATPFGQSKDPLKISKELDEYNAVAGQLCGERQVMFINITDISRKAAMDPDLTANDQLHPSAKMYGLWIDAIAPVVDALLAK